VHLFTMTLSSPRMDYRLYGVPEDSSTRGHHSQRLTHHMVSFIRDSPRGITHITYNLHKRTSGSLLDFRENSEWFPSKYVTCLFINNEAQVC
jgi:hypothetical protein